MLNQLIQLEKVDKLSGTQTLVRLQIEGGHNIDEQQLDPLEKKANREQ